MARINLRPWREEQAQQRKKQFASNSLAVALLAAVVVFGIGQYFDEMKSRQMARNNFIKAETVKLDQKIVEIRDLNSARDRLLQRLNAIQELQGTRPLIVRNFDELVRVLPDGLFYTSLTRNADKLNLSGTASSNLEVSELMRSLDASIWFGEPQLSNVGSASPDEKAFKLSVDVSKPKLEEVPE